MFSGFLVDFQCVVVGFGDVYFGGDFVVFGVGDDDVVCLVFGEIV